jgi:hypothetical protein
VCGEQDNEVQDRRHKDVRDILTHGARSFLCLRCKGVISRHTLPVNPPYDDLLHCCNMDTYGLI